MQFLKPEFLWAFLALLIPVIVHLFQLRRFRKTPFTNVRLLEKVVSKSRKSSRLKKWLLLCCRLLLLTFLILAFAQPYFPTNSGLINKQRVVYLDNSFSMDYPEDNASVLTNLVQELLLTLPENSEVTLFTNTREFKNASRSTLQSGLLNLEPVSEQLSLEQVLLKANTLFEAELKSEKELWVLSDLQDYQEGVSLPEDLSLVWVNTRPETVKNTAIDSAYLTRNGAGKIELNALLSSTTEEAITVSLYDRDSLIAKTATISDTKGVSKAIFSLEDDTKLSGRLSITDKGLPYDNELFLSIPQNPKIKVLIISERSESFLNRIYTEDEFELNYQQPNQIDYNVLAEQQLIVLNELSNLPSGLHRQLELFVKNQGHLVIIPGLNLSRSPFNAFLRSVAGNSIAGYKRDTVVINTVNITHPVYKGVFENAVENFQYPRLLSYYTFEKNFPAALTLQNGNPFLLSNQNVYFFSSPLNTSNSNFTASPLVVPTFYAIGKNSLKLPNLYQQIGDSQSLDLPIQLNPDETLELYSARAAYIPLQKSLADKVTLTFNDIPEYSGNYEIRQKGDPKSILSFNFSRKESDLDFADVRLPQGSRTFKNLKDLLVETQNESSIASLWKWFVILALVFALTEIFIQKMMQ